MTDSPSLPRARRATIAIRLYSSLREQIVRGDYAPMQLLSENDIAQSFGVSRTPVREALGKLEEDKLVSIQPQYGTFVAPISLSHNRTSQFVREALECTAIQAAAAQCTPEAAGTLQALLKTQATATSEQAFFEADEAMHHFLMALAGQAEAWRVVADAKLHLDRVRHLAVRTDTKRRMVLEEHRQIVACVTAQDAAGAAAAMRAHLRGVFASTERIAQEHPAYFQDTKFPMRPLRRRQAEVAPGSP